MKKLIFTTSFYFIFSNSTFLEINPNYFGAINFLETVHGIAVFFCHLKAWIQSEK